MQGKNTLKRQLCEGKQCGDMCGISPFGPRYCVGHEHKNCILLPAPPRCTGITSTMIILHLCNSFLELLKYMLILSRIISCSRTTVAGSMPPAEEHTSMSSCLRNSSQVKESRSASMMRWSPLWTAWVSCWSMQTSQVSVFLAVQLTRSLVT